MHDAQERVAVLGAAGFVGRELLRRLQERGVRATAVVRGAPELSVDGDFHCACHPRDCRNIGGFDAVVNLAYPNSGPPYEYPSRDEEIVRTVTNLVTDGGRLIHVSTLAVFGMALDRPIELGPVAAVRDHPYVESKVAAERAMLRKQSEHGLSLDIVRLGNVFGAASAAWGVPLIQRLLTGRPVGVEGRIGLSNTTDVVNAAAYLAHLLQAGDAGPGVQFHHAAEFSSVAWKDWIDPTAEALGVVPVLADPSALNLPSSGWEEVAGAIARSPRGLYRSFAAERVAGSWTRSLLRSLPRPLFARAKGSDVVSAAPLSLGPDDQTFLAIMAAEQEFTSSVRGDWSPPVTRDQSLSRFLEWLERR